MGGQEASGEGAVRGAVRRAVSGDAPRCGQRRLAPSMRRCRDRAGHEGRECVYGYAEWVTVWGLGVQTAETCQAHLV